MIAVLNMPMLANQRQEVVWGRLLWGEGGEAIGDGIERRDFWGSWVLAGAESDEVLLHDVEVPDSLMFRMGESHAGH